MKQTKFNFLVVFSIALFLNTNSIFAQTKSDAERVGETVSVENKNIDWEGFDKTSTIPQTAITYENLQGLWNAYEGVYRFGEHINAMKLSQPMIMEVKNKAYRRNSKSEFINFTIKDNLITAIYQNKEVIGIINKISENELIISWKDNQNYTRYIYKK